MAGQATRWSSAAATSWANPRPLLLTADNATVTLCHSKTRDLQGQMRRGGYHSWRPSARRSFVTADMVKEGAVVIDVGINRER